MLCQHCGATNVSTIQLVRLSDTNNSNETVCYPCFYKATEPQVPARPESPVFENGPRFFVSVHKTLQEAALRADKVEAFLRVRPIVEHDARGHLVVGDSPLVPGWKPSKDDPYSK